MLTRIPLPRLVALSALLIFLSPSLMAQDHLKGVKKSTSITYLNPPNNDLVAISKVVKQFDAAGELLEEKHEFNGKFTLWEKHVVEQGKRTATIHFGELGTETARSDYSYNAFGKLSSIEKRDQDGNLQLHTSYKYLPDGKISEYLRHSADSSTFMHASYHYDSKGHLEETRWYDKDNKVRTSIQYTGNASLPKQVADALAGIGMESKKTEYKVGKKKVFVYKKDKTGKRSKAAVLKLNESMDVEAVEHVKGAVEIEGLEGGQRREIHYNNKGQYSLILTYEKDELQTIQKFIYEYHPGS